MAAFKPRRNRMNGAPPRAFRRNKAVQDVGAVVNALGSR